MWDDDFDNEEYERLTYDYDSTIYYSGNPKNKQADSSSKSTNNTISSSYYDNFYEDDYS